MYLHLNGRWEAADTNGETDGSRMHQIVSGFQRFAIFCKDFRSSKNISDINISSLKTRYCTTSRPSNRIKKEHFKILKNSPLSVNPK